MVVSGQEQLDGWAARAGWTTRVEAAETHDDDASELVLERRVREERGISGRDGVQAFGRGGRRRELKSPASRVSREEGLQEDCGGEAVP